ncbi:hypothetical protein FDW86_18390 [Citrobacter sp. wls828]|nr:hypothetical protein AL515_23455 [Citrobacter sp. FDAARGOS_156]AYL63123.1 hypothetical protein CUC49_16555 [Citrobacter pasteurii]NHM12180.1 hypothetical protein [Citrobacter youngae]TKU05471.1 hypothetical protein FDW86_18390 [Citrobacter sp. wls828]TKU37811.1 hypothetical protein FDX24_19300 [Citrobacter sp. wls716]TKU93480.1 hypothetical protein FDX00_10920 [Citrobacter sp. wls617]
MCKTREFPLAGEQNATLSSLIKGRYAAFFLSLQYINILSIGKFLQVFDLRHFILNFAARRFDNHHVILLFTNQATSNR